MDKRIKEYKEIYTKLVGEILFLEEEFENTKKTIEKSAIKREIDKKNFFLEEFICNDYASVVFEVYSSKRCKIKDTFTNEVKTWEEFFGTDFNKLTKLKRKTLVSLVEKSGAYRLTR